MPILVTSNPLNNLSLHFPAYHQYCAYLEESPLEHAGVADELGAGTDPQEGSALARAILQNLVEKKVPCLIATHYPELKAFAHTDRVS